MASKIPKLQLPPKTPRKIDWSQLYKDGAFEQLVNPVSGDIYIINDFLGVGTYGYVFRAFSSRFGVDIALKIFNITNDNDTDFKAELESYIYLSHMPTCQKHIVCLYDSFVIPDIHTVVSTIPHDNTKRSIGIGIYELMDGDLDHEKVADEEIPFLLVDLLDGLDFIHTNGFAHRDIKPSNLLLKHSKSEGEGVIFKLGDLGLTCSEKFISPSIDEEEKCEYWGTKLYVSPEALQHWGQDATLEEAQQMDIWMLGVSLFQIIFLRYPFIANETYLRNLTQQQVDTVLNEKTPYPRQENSLLSSYEIISILSRMLKVDPTKRASAHELLDYIHALASVKAELFPEESPEELALCDPLLARFNAQQLIRELEKAVLDRIRNNTEHYKVHLENIQAIQDSKCIDEDYLNTIYRIYHDDIIVRSSMRKPDNLIFLGDLALSHLDELHSVSPQTQTLSTLD